MRKYLFLFVGFLFLPLAAAANQWPDYRGPHGNGISDATNPPTQWSETKNIKWKTPIHDRGNSSPVIWNNQVWLTTATKDGHKLYAICIDRETGKILLDKIIFNVDEPQDSHNLNSFASPSPVIEADRVYLHFGTYGTACLDTKTFKTLWQRRDLNCDHFVGPGSSPILYKDMLIFNVDGGDVQYIIALDKLTGKTRWKTTRSGNYEGRNPDYCKAFSTPLICSTENRTELVSAGAQVVNGYDPDTGRELWKFTYKGFSIVWRPVTANGIVYINTGFGDTHLLAIKLGGSGDVTDSHLLWKQKKYIDCRPSPLLIDNRIYVLGDTGMAACLNAQTGEKIWSQRVSGNHSASLISANDLIYICNQDGKTTVIKTGDTFEKVSENQLDEGFMASPAIAQNALYLRTQTHLYRIQNTPEN